jgi:hypothetical protein
VSTVAADASARRRLSREAKIGLAAVGAVVAIRIVGGNFIANDWEGWGTFITTAVGAAIEGLILWGLVFGLVVGFSGGLRGSWPGVVAVMLGVLAVLSLAIPYSAPQALLGAGAVALGLVSLDRADRPSSQPLGRAAVAMGLLVIAAWLSFVALTFVTGEWPEVL